MKRTHRKTNYWLGFVQIKWTIGGEHHHLRLYNHHRHHHPVSRIPFCQSIKVIIIVIIRIPLAPQRLKTGDISATTTKYTQWQSRSSWATPTPVAGEDDNTKSVGRHLSRKGFMFLLLRLYQFSARIKEKKIVVMWCYCCCWRPPPRSYESAFHFECFCFSWHHSQHRYDYYCFF